MAELEAHRRTARNTVVAWLLAGIAATGCTGVDPSGSSTGRTGPSSVDVSLQEWSIVPAEAVIAAGPVTFTARNNGPDAPHELVILLTDLEPGELPTRSDGLVDESGTGVELVGEIEELDVGATDSATFELAPGQYVLICNLDYYGPHYSAGMRVGITVR